MDVDHPRAGVHRGVYGLRHGVGNVVKLEVEEDAGARSAKRAHELRALAREEAAADLESPRHALERRRQVERTLTGLDIERD